ncbi:MULTISPECIES: hypothetical protein [unclassified Citromicrobium]|uniref:hypothetical protein n=1 Tax=unclassified Citromicrobium TaxID=2630544 RepID=UPI000AAC149F|nr:MULTISPECIES: hypothetical protein [unclassified Citromicrobium]
MIEIAIFERVLASVARAGSPDYIHHCGATIEEIAALLAAGATEEAGWAMIIHVSVHPNDRKRLMWALPVLVRNRFWFNYRRLPQPEITRWCEENNDWAETIRGCASRPPRFARLIDAQARQIASIAA